MAEKQEHGKLRKIIKNWVETKFSNDNLMIFEDDPENPLGYGVQKLSNRYPDLHAYSIKDEIEVIGEAKTKNDINNEHTKSQLKDYIDYLKIFKNNGYLIFAVPYDNRAEMINLIRNFVREMDNELLINIFVIEDIFELATAVWDVFKQGK